MSRVVFKIFNSWTGFLSNSFKWDSLLYLIEETQNSLFGENKFYVFLFCYLI